MDYALLFVYTLATVISLCILILVFLFGFLVLLISKKNPNESYEYLKNLVYAVYGGIIAIILLELKGESIANPYFWTIKMPLALLTVLIFILFGFLYLYLLKRIFNWVKLNKGRNNIKPMIKRKHVTYVLLFFLVLSALIFFVFGMNEILGIIFLVLSVATYISNNEIWGDQFREKLGVATFAGFMVSLLKDISSDTLTPKLQVMYFMGLALAVLLLTKSASKGEEL